MVKDIHIRILFIPLLGILLPYASGLISYREYTLAEIVAFKAYSIFISWLKWTGCNRAHVFIRKKINVGKNVYIRIGTIAFVSALYSVVIGGGLVSIWLLLSKEKFTWAKVFEFTFYTAVAVTLFTLLYEVVFLNDEKEKQMKLTNQLELDWQHAETSILRNEMDPHFIFNSLTTLNHLIAKDPARAAFYNKSLAQVYKYVLQNKNKKTVQLADELEFIKDYFSLLQIRFENKLHLAINPLSTVSTNFMIVPCALQILIENAIKHNELSDTALLSVTIDIHDHYLQVSNNILPAPAMIASTETGLKNLSSRYKLISNKDISIHKNNKIFSVTLPLISSVKTYNYA